LAFREWIATKAEIPATMAMAKIARRRRWVRLSRHAIRHVHGWINAPIKVRGNARGELTSGIFLLGKNFASTHPDYPARLSRQARIMRYQDQCCSRFPVETEQHLHNR